MLRDLLHAAKNCLWRGYKMVKPRYFLLAMILVAAWWYAGIVDPNPGGTSLRGIIVWTVLVVWFFATWPRKK